MSLNQRVTAEFSTCTPSAPPTADLSIQTIRTSNGRMVESRGAVHVLDTHQKIWKLTSVFIQPQSASHPPLPA
jgi:hypothetical protein